MHENLNGVVALANRDMEANVLGQVIVNNDLIFRLDLEPRHFSLAELGEVWGMLQTAIRGGQTVTPVNFRSFMGGNGFDALAKELATVALNGWPVDENYARHMRDEHKRRKARQTAEELYDALDGPNADIGHHIAMAVTDLRESLDVRELAEAETIHDSVVEEMGKPVEVYATGIEVLDEITMGGLQAGMFYGIGGRFKAGKSFLLTTISYNLLGQCNHLYLTLESNAQQLYKRMLARSMGVNANVFLDPNSRRNPGFIERVEASRAQLTGKGFYMQTVPRMDLASLRSTIEQAVVKHGIKGAMVDYMQLVGGDIGGGKALHYEDVAQTLSELTREFGIWIVAAAQINAQGSVRWGEGLLLACDMAMTLHRCDQESPGINESDSWLEMTASRYTPVRNAGAEDNPALVFDAKIGPHFRSL